MSEPEPITRLVDHVFALGGLLGAAGDAIAEPEGLSAARWLVLGALADGPLTPAEVARRRGLQRQSVRESVLRLEASGHLARAAGPDRRTFLVELTDAGREALDRIEPRRAAWAERTASVLDPDALDITVETLGRLRDSLAK